MHDSTVTPRGRVKREPNWPAGGMVTYPMADHRYEVQAFTGRPVSNIQRGQWVRGSIVRYETAPLRPDVDPLVMMDPTDPVRYVTVLTKERKRGLLRARRR